MYIYLLLIILDITHHKGLYNLNELFINVFIIFKAV